MSSPSTPTCGVGSKCTNVFEVIVKGKKKDVLTGGEATHFKNLAAGILSCGAKDTIAGMNLPLHDYGFAEADFKAFPLSIKTNQQRLMTNACDPFNLESEKAIHRKCF